MLTIKTIKKNAIKELEENIELWSVAKISTEGTINELKQFLIQSIQKAYSNGYERGEKSILNIEVKTIEDDPDSIMPCSVTKTVRDFIKGNK